jgi:hypothetical protein
MMNRVLARAACALLLAAPIMAADAAPGDVFVPAHRTRDGHYVPPNVPPLSGGTHLARRPTRGKAVHSATRQRTSLDSPVLTEARALRR